MPCLDFCLRIFPYLWFLLFFPPFFDPWNPALLVLDPPGNLGFLYPEMSFTLSLEKKLHWIRILKTADGLYIFLPPHVFKLVYSKTYLVFILPPFFFPPKPNFLSLYFLLSSVFSPFLLWKVGLFFRLNGPPVIKKIKICVSNRYYHILLGIKLRGRGRFLHL